MFALSIFCMFIDKKFELLWLIMHFSKLESIHAIGTNSQVKGSNKLFDFLEQSNQRKNCDSKIYYTIFLVPHLHIIYNLWTWLFATCS